MARFTLTDILTATGGTLLQGAAEEVFEGVSTDSRSSRPGDLFVALRGEHWDGHQFIGEAFAKGARGALISEARHAWRQPGESTRHGHARHGMIQVKDTLAALGALARYHRQRFAIPTVGITGSNGKSTTKEMTAAVLARRWNVLKNSGNLNNLIGLPLSLFGLTSQHHVAVLEMGMNRPGEIRSLAQIARPTIGVLTNISEAHLEGLGSLEGIRRAKGELLEVMGPAGVAVLNADDPKVMELRAGFSGRVLTFGVECAADIRGIDLVCDHQGRPGFHLRCGHEEARVHLPVSGYHNVYNALAAATVAHALGLSLAEIEAGLLVFQPMPMRLQVIDLPQGRRLINDTYNANPSSVEMAITTLGALPPKGPKVLVLGDMLELGAAAEALHRRVGGAVAQSGIDALVTVGPLACFIVEEAIRQGFPVSRAQACETVEQAQAVVLQLTPPRSSVVVKGSRGVHMERLVEALLTVWKDG
ncbi:MAG: UDP-N-acetylmuramoyl-tripeptide--D-alanyl-D-alanine ligase [Nitrospinae bacterium]|nr:UDP-N-acetylmuramoyl-tripeptide--D-alanyl-D-alanine ligase [Nitrospinota bacterium]